MSKASVTDSKACEYDLFVARSLIRRGPGDSNFFDFFELLVDFKFQSLCQKDNINER